MALRKLVDAARYLESIYWRQNDKASLVLYQGLAGCSSQSDRSIRHFLLINGSRFDLLEENKPFIGKEPFPPGRENFPKDITQKEIDDYVAAHPDKKNAIYSPFTVIKRQGSDLVAVPYHVEYKEWLEPAARTLREAADLSDDKAFAKFLRLRADALLTDDYYASDIAIDREQIYVGAGEDGLLVFRRPGLTPSAPPTDRREWPSTTGSGTRRSPSPGSW